MLQAAAMLAGGGEVWVGDETALREFPPLRAGWSKRGQPAPVLISGRNGRRTLLGALQVSTGELVCTVRERCRTERHQQRRGSSRNWVRLPEIAMLIRADEEEVVADVKHS